MFQILKKKNSEIRRVTPKLCSECGFDLSGQHWNHCPRCHTPPADGNGCGGCGNCKH